MCVLAECAGAGVDVGAVLELARRGDRAAVSAALKQCGLKTGPRLKYESAIFAAVKGAE